MDIKFEVDGYKFNVRSSCIIKNKTHSKVLLTNMRAITDHEAFLLPGGRLELLENSDEAIKREIEEEIGVRGKIIKYFGRIGIEYYKLNNIN